MPSLARRLVASSLVLPPARAWRQSPPEAPPHRAPVPVVDEAGPGGPFGFYGPDVFVDQSVAQRFTLPAGPDYRLARVGLWLMNNSVSEHRLVKLSLQTDALD